MIVYLTIAARHILAPSDEGAVERSETEGEINKEYQYISLPPSRLTPCHLPRQREVLAVAIRKINSNLRKKAVRVSELPFVVMRYFVSSF